MISNENNIRIVLVRPRNPLNIGAAARAMMNFAFHDLVLVSPHEPVLQESKSAPGAEALLRDARVVPDLLDAVKDRTLVLGTSSLSRRNVARQVISLDQLSVLPEIGASRSRVALVFGSEKTGLTTKDLSYCHWIVRIPTTLRCPSMNLAQAVAVCCYELKRWLNIKREDAGVNVENQIAIGPIQPATVEEVERLANQMERLASGSTSLAGGPAIIRITQLRQMLLRWPITSQDVTMALGILRDISWQLRSKL